MSGYPRMRRNRNVRRSNNFQGNFITKDVNFACSWTALYFWMHFRRPMRSHADQQFKGSAEAGQKNAELVCVMESDARSNMSLKYGICKSTKLTVERQTAS